MTASETIAAAGIAQALIPKCLRAKTYARVGDLLKVSTTNARLEVSAIDVKCVVNNKANPPPISGNRQDDAMAVTQFISKDETELAAPPATNINVAIIATLGHDGAIFRANWGFNRPMANPKI